MVIVILPLTQKGLLSVMCAEYKLTAQSKHAKEKSLVRFTDRLDMTIAVDWEMKPQTNQTSIFLWILTIVQIYLAL